MFVKEYGSGERQFLCFHGWGGDHREFAPLAKRAPSDVCLMSVDLPGYGLSSKPDEWSMNTITHEAAAVLRDRDMLSCTLIGFCSGIGPALMLGALEPDRVNRVVMIDPFAFVPWYFRLFLSGEFGRRAYATTFQTPVGRKITDWILKRFQTSDADFTGAFIDLDHDVTLRYLQMLNRVDIRKEFHGLQMDIDLFYGENTFEAVRRSVVMYKRLLPQIRVEKLRGVGHLPMIRGARQLAAAIFESSNTVESPKENPRARGGRV